MEENFSYNKAVEELEGILAEIEDDNIDLDLLIAKIKRATVLISDCKSKLKQTSDEIDNILGEWESKPL